MKARFIAEKLLDLSVCLFVELKNDNPEEFISIVTRIEETAGDARLSFEGGMVEWDAPIEREKEEKK